MPLVRVRPLMSFRALGAVTLLALGAAASTLAAQVTPPTPPRPAPRPAPAGVPSPASAPRAPRPTSEWEALRMLDDIKYEALDAARAAIAIDQKALAEMVRAQTLDASRLAMEQAQIARAVAPLAADAAAEAAALAPLAALGALDAAAYAPYDAMSWGSAKSRGYRTEVPEPWAQQDPADSLYREARKALSGDAYRKAADLFKAIRQRYPKSAYAPDAPYWEAFALHRLGGEANLRLAQDALGLQQRDYPKAATRGDASALSARIDGQLGRRDQALASTLVDRATRAASDGCPYAKDDERIEALNAVTQMDQEQAAPILKKVLARRDPCTQQLRRAAVSLVASRKLPDAAPTLMNVARTDPDKEVREQAVFWLANVATDEAVGMLIDLAKNSDDMDLRKRAVYSLSRSKNPRAASTLREILVNERESDEVRGEAMSWLISRSAESGSDTAFTLLKEVFRKSEGLGFRQRVLSLMGRYRTDEARAFYVSVALDEREAMDLRRTALSMISSSGSWSYNYSSAQAGSRLAVASVGGQQVNVVTTGTAGSASSSTSAERPQPRESATAAVAALSQVYDKATDLDIRRQALSQLVSVRDNAGLDKVIDIARNEKVLDLRRTAVSSIPRFKDPRAVAFLQEIINK
ncbi:MAG: HEAT repeat domain-containing protein [Gemmatimonadetes bacterium]|nr:HEAT repeat domain-containing protein [Gemmatimonadota bacterium]